MDTTARSIGTLGTVMAGSMTHGIMADHITPAGMDGATIHSGTVVHTGAMIHSTMTGITTTITILDTSTEAMALTVWVSAIHGAHVRET